MTPVEELAVDDWRERYVIACHGVHNAEAHLADNKARHRPTDAAERGLARAVARRDAVAELMPV